MKLTAAEAVAPSIRLGDANYLDSGAGDWLGFYDWLRNRQGEVIGVQQWVDETSNFPFSTRFGGVEANAKHGVLRIFFGQSREVDEENSCDQDFGSNRLLVTGESVALTEKNQSNAIAWFQRASDAGLHRALVSLAEVYIQERGDPDSVEEGLAFLRKGASLDHAPSITFLGELLRDGVGKHPPNLGAAIELWQRLLVLDPWVASYELAKVYETGHGVPQSTEKAIEYFRMARKAGHPEAYRNLRRLGAEP